MWSFWNMETNQFADQFSESQTFYIFYSDKSFRFYNCKISPSFCCCCPNSDFSYIWTISLASKMFCLSSVSFLSRSFCEPLLHQFSVFYLENKPLVWLSSSLNSVLGSHLLLYIPLIQSSQSTPPFPHRACSFLPPSLYSNIVFSWPNIS